jgi:hypothetical protein
MMKNKIYCVECRNLIVLLMLSFLMFGCAGIKPARMVPELQQQSEWRVGNSVKVMDVTGGQEPTFGGPEMINDDDFKAALIATLEKSRLFRVVGTNSGDIYLYATIRSQEQRTGPGLQYTARLVVSYKFVDKAGEVVWLESYESEFSSVAFAGATRTVEAREGSVIENLASLIQGIRERWPKQ